MAAEYAVPAAILVVAVAVALLTVRIPALFISRSPHSDSNPAYEYGSRTVHKTWVQFHVRYAVLALLFVAFDMEMVYMFPWAVVFKRLGLVAFLDMFVFIAILAAAIAFAWKEGAFDWEG